MKLLFIDFDGCFRLRSKSGLLVWEPAALERLRYILHAADAWPVIISQLRLTTPPEEFAKLLDYLRIPRCSPAHAIRGRDRRAGIELWLKEHPDCTRWAVIDDEARHYEGWNSIQKAGLFLCCSRFGLQASTADRAICHLNGVEPEANDETDDASL
jgi:HAD domain in Swiss Army Knife RNA repair proteins